jgi:hypothetical protein
MADIPIAIDDPVKDEGIIRERLMDELCKRQRDTERNGKPEPWSITDVWQSSFPAFLSREYIDRFIERYRTYSEYFEILPNDMIQLTERGKRYCRDLERITVD